jgi:hypothetical protein
LVIRDIHEINGDKSAQTLLLYVVRGLMAENVPVILTGRRPLDDEGRLKGSLRMYVMHNLTIGDYGFDVSALKRYAGVATAA